MIPPPDLDRPAEILIVDDTLENLQVLIAALRSLGHVVRPVRSGAQALDTARFDPPELILLDINMPGMNGYEVCERLKREPHLQAIPVIFISALDEVVDKVKAFNAGAADYIAKPFEFEEVTSRVRTHLRLARYREELERHNERLEEQVARRTQALAAVNARLEVLDKTKSDFLTIISHEVRTPLAGILATAEFLLYEFESHPDAAKFNAMYEQSRHRMMSLIEDALLLAEIGVKGDLMTEKHCELPAVLEAALAKAEVLAKFRGVTLPAMPTNLERVMGEATNLTRAVQALLETAIKFAASGTAVRAMKLEEPGLTGLVFEANGFAVPGDLLPRFFDLLAIAEAITPGGDLGVAPALAERIIRLQGGTVAVENIMPAGIRLTMRMPKVKGP